MFERLASTDLMVGAAVAVFVVSALFIVAVSAAALRRTRGQEVGNRLGGLVGLVGGAALGTLLLFAPDLTIAAPLVLTPAVVALTRWRAGRHAQASSIVFGTALPIAVAWALLVIDQGRRRVAGAPPPAEVVLWLGGAILVGAFGLFIMVRGDPAPPTPAIDSRAGQPGSRAIGSIAAAIREPAMIGPFGLPEIAMLIAFVSSWLLIPLFLPRDAGILIQIGVPSLVGAVLGAEAYIRAMPPRSRRAFEAFSWLGEWEIARARAAIGGLPTSPRDGEVWLAAHPETRITNLDELPIRVEILLLAGRVDDARAAIDRLPALDEWDRFERAALADLVAWRSGGDGDLAAMEVAAEKIQPPDGDDRLRADVMIAVAMVRRRMADGRAAAGDAAQPLLDVRPRLGHRADGQVGRALRRRLIPVLLVVSIGFGFISALVGSIV